MSSINRRPHTLQREKSLTIPRHFVFFDTETIQVQQDDGSIRQDFKLGWAVYYRRSYLKHNEKIEWFNFDTPSLFWDFLFSHTTDKQRVWVIARNVVFDFTVLAGWKHLKAEGYKLKFFHNNGVSVIVTVQKGSKKIVFLDSMNWFTESLAKTGDRIGIPKMEIDFNTCTKEELSVYCRNDVLIEFENFRIFIKFLEANLIGRLCYTKASTAMAAYLFRHYHSPIYIHNNAEAITLERESYKGGRCECFYIGELNHGKHYTLDVNSLYPYCMANYMYPTKYKALRHHIRVQDLRDTLETMSVVAKVLIQTDEPVYAVKQERTIFPVGRFEVTLCTPELKYALEHGHIKRVIHCVSYEQSDIFRTYVESMYKLRQEFKCANVREYEQICKYLLNSLYGKFGQKAEQWKKIGEAPNEPDREELLFPSGGKRVKRIRYLLGEIFELTGHSEAFNSFPAISAHVTAYGRMYLWSLMKLCGQGHYFYCDTDSLIVDSIGLKNLKPAMDDLDLGKLKLEYETRKLIIRGLKDYETDTKLVIKGIRKNSKQVADRVYTQEQWPTFRGLLKSGDANVYNVGKITKHLSREYTKGIVTETGIVTPFVLQLT